MHRFVLIGVLLIAVGRIFANEIDFLAHNNPSLDDEGADSMKIDDDESSFTFDDLTLYKLTWPNYVPPTTPSPDGVEPPEKKKESEVKIYDIGEKAEYEEVIMTNHLHEKYRCLIPVLDKPKEKLLNEVSGNAPNPYHLLSSLLGQNICTERTESFWTYEICHGHYIRQYHEDGHNKENSQEYFLGRFNAADLEQYEKNYDKDRELGKKIPTVSVFDFTLPYVEVNMTEGTLCDLSKKKRVTKVLYVCVEGNFHDLYSIKETFTCEYEVITFTSLLCASPEFRMKIAQENDVKCYPMEDAPPVPTGFEMLENKPQIEKLNAKKKQQERTGKNEPFAEEALVLQRLLQGGGEEKEIFKIPIAVKALVNHRYSIKREFLAGDHCLIGGFGWWKYEFCYGKKVLQFHEKTNSEDEILINLGRWDLEKHIKWLEANPSKKAALAKSETLKQVSHFYSEGDVCEQANNKRRSVEVRLKCVTGSSFESVTIHLVEPSICEYVLNVEAAMFCELMENVDEYGLFKSVTLEEK